MSSTRRSTASAAPSRLRSPVTTPSSVSVLHPRGTKSVAFAPSAGTSCGSRKRRGSSWPTAAPEALSRMIADRMNLRIDVCPNYSRRLALAVKKVFQLRRGRERGACAERAALERGHGAPKGQTALYPLAAQQPVDKACVEGVARAGRVAAAAGDFVGRCLDKPPFVVDDRAALAQSHPDHGVRPQTRLRLDERRALLRQARQALRELL